MKINKLYFSPTGSTKKVVALIAEAFGGELCEFDFSVADLDYSTFSFAKDELCIIGVPSFGGRVPAVALAHLAQMKAAGTPAVLVTAYGNRDFDDTLLELQTAARECGFHVIAAIAAVAEHSIMHEYGAGRPDDNDKRELRDFAARIKQALESGGALPEITVKGNTPYREYKGLPMKPRADKSCTKCGTCARLCPVNAIPAERPDETDKDRCITCMRCVAVCPSHARKLNPALLFAAGQAMKKACSEPKKNVMYL